MNRGWLRDRPQITIPDSVRLPILQAIFPHIECVETVCALSKLSEAKHHISVQVDMDELDVTAAESKATYEEIQEWVQEKYGFHVTHLNIAKTKRKCGIIERQNYNLPKSENSRSPETPKEKKETIMELSLDRDFSSNLPEGLQLREMDQIADRDALEWLFWQGFDHGDDREAFERSRDHVPHVRRHFNKALCLSAADPSGEPVSHCSLWFHQDTDYAYVEPVCTIPGYRGKGIAAALLSETFSSAKALGAKKAYVISDLPFYEKLGFEKTQHYSFYRKA